MASKVEAVESALEALKLVAKGYHVPFDTSTLEGAVKDLLADLPKEERKELKADQPEEKPAEKPAEAPKPEQRAPIGVPKGSV